MKKCCIEPRRRVISCIQQIQGRLTGLVTSCIGTAFLKIKKKIIKMKVIEGKMEGREVTGRRGRSRKQLLNDHEEKKRYGNFKDEAVDRAVQRTRCGRGYGPVVRQRQEDKRRN